MDGAAENTAVPKFVFTNSNATRQAGTWIVRLLALNLDQTGMECSELMHQSEQRLIDWKLKKVSE